MSNRFQAAELDGQLRNFLTLQALDQVSDLHFAPSHGGYMWRGRKLGCLQELEVIGFSKGLQLIASLKSAARLDPTERTIPQDGRFSVTSASQQTVDCRINCLPTISGEKVVLRLLPVINSGFSLKHSGLTESQHSTVDRVLQQPDGLILITGSTGSGKTRTLYGLAQQLNCTSKNLTSAEDPVEMLIPGISQVAISQNSRLNFASTLRALLRQDPDVLLVGEIRDQETARICCQAAQTGHLVLATLHSRDVFSAIMRLYQLGVSPHELASCLQLVSFQRLIKLKDRRTGQFELTAMNSQLKNALLDSLQGPNWKLIAAALKQNQQSSQAS